MRALSVGNALLKAWGDILHVESGSAPSLLTSLAAPLSSMVMSPPFPILFLFKLDDQEAALTCKDRLSIDVLVGAQHSLAVAAVTSTGVVKGGWR